jgi:vacuolar-type H+-ATPase subunit H
MEKNPGQSVLMKTVGEIRAVEEKHDHAIEHAKAEADKILRNAREKLAEEREKMEDEITGYKNARLKEGRASIEKDAERILDKARHDGEGMKKKRMASSKLLPIAISMLE